MTAPSTAPDLTFHELFTYTAAENERWHQWFAAQTSAVLDLPFAEPPIATVRQLVRHVGFVEHRYAAVLGGRAVPEAQGTDSDDADILFAYLTDGRRQLEATVAQAADTGFDRVVEFMTLSAGLQRASVRKVIGHALLHGIRHWAQLATLLRASGYPTGWSHDLLFSTALR